MTVFDRISKGDVRIALALLTTLFIFSIVILILTHKIPEGSNDLAYLTVGSLLAVFTQIISYYFGSSKNEADKQLKER